MKTKSQNINIGSSSILMIFVILCLISFASLSLVSSASDYKLSKNLQEKTSEYYSACNKAEASIASIDNSLKESAALLTEEEYYLSVGKIISFYIPINDLQSLYIALTPHYPSTDGDFYYELTNYEVVTLEPLEVDHSIEFFTP